MPNVSPEALVSCNSVTSINPEDPVFPSGVPWAEGAAENVPATSTSVDL